GSRVRKTTGSTTIDYLYDLGGHVVTEVSSSGAWNRGEIFAGGKHLATYANSTTYFTHADWLGTERIRTDKSGTTIETCTYLPFGDGQTCTGSGGDPSPLLFNRKQRGTETGDDHSGARCVSSDVARGPPPHWCARPAGAPNQVTVNVNVI